MIVSKTNAPPTLPPLAAVTVSVAVAPEVPATVAEIVVVPAPTAVARPEEFTVATVGVLEAQAACPVTSSVLEG
jgi:hypothetical protein